MPAQVIDVEGIGRQRLSDQRILQELRVALEQLDPKTRISLPQGAVELLDSFFEAAPRRSNRPVALAAAPLVRA